MEWVNSATLTTIGFPPALVSHSGGRFGVIPRQNLFEFGVPESSWLGMIYWYCLGHIDGLFKVGMKKPRRCVGGLICAFAEYVPLWVMGCKVKQRYLWKFEDCMIKFRLEFSVQVWNDHFWNTPSHNMKFVQGCLGFLSQRCSTWHSPDRLDGCRKFLQVTDWMKSRAWFERGSGRIKLRVSVWNETGAAILGCRFPNGKMPSLWQFVCWWNMSATVSLMAVVRSSGLGAT